MTAAIPLRLEAAALALMDDKIELDVAALDGPFVLMLRATSLSPTECSDLSLRAEVKDAQFPSSPAIRIQEVRELESAGDDARLWVGMPLAADMKSDLVNEPAHDWLLAASSRGVPLFTEGLRLLVAELRLFDSSDDGLARRWKTYLWATDPD